MSEGVSEVLGVVGESLAVAFVVFAGVADGALAAIGAIGWEMGAGIMLLG